MMSVVFYKNLGSSNTFIGQATSFFYLPWVLKFIWSPLVDVRGTKRKWIIICQATLGFIALSLVASIFLPAGTYISIGIFMLIALASATQDVAIDGYYLDVLKKEQQAFYVGVRNAFYKVAVLAGSGGLVFLAGKIAETTQLGVQGGWSIAFVACGLLLLGCAAFHAFVLPETGNKLEGSEGVAPTLGLAEFIEVFLSWLRQPRIAVIILYILIFRAGDALLIKMAQPFLLDDVAKGGLGIATSDVGIIYGTVGVIFLLLGGIVGGVLVSKYGLKKCLMPTALIQNSAIPLYWWLAAAKPAGDVLILNYNVTQSMQSIIGSNPDLMHWFDARFFYTIMVNSAEQFSYGLGTAAYTVFLLTTVKSDFKAAHYAIATALMAFGVMIPGFISGQIADAMGYEKFFLISFIAAIPGIITILWLPLPPAEKDAKEAD